MKPKPIRGWMLRDKEKKEPYEVYLKKLEPRYISPAYELVPIEIRVVKK